MTDADESLVPASHIRTVHTDRSTIVVNYLDGNVTLLNGRARPAWLTRLRGSPTVPIRASDPTSSWGTQEVLAYLPEPAPSPLLMRLAALLAILAVLAVKQLGSPTRTFHRLHVVCRIGSRLPAACATRAQQAVRAVRWAARLIPARVACLEESVAAVLLLAAAGKRARWRHGIATDPIRLHAWIVDPDGVAVEEPAETAHYTTITELPAPPTKGTMRP